MWHWMLLTDGQVSHQKCSSSSDSIALLCSSDNVFAVRSWCKNKFGLEDSVIDKQFSIPEDFDYIN